MDYLNKQIEERRLKKRALEREIGDAEAAIKRVQGELKVLEAELGAYLDIAEHRKDIGFAGLPGSGVASPRVLEVPGAVQGNDSRPGWLDKLSGDWRRYYDSLIRVCSEFTTDDVMDLTRGEPSPPPRKSIRGTLGKHVAKGFLERIEDGRFRFVRADQMVPNFGASLLSELVSNENGSP